MARKPENWRLYGRCRSNFKFNVEKDITEIGCHVFGLGKE